MLDDSGWFRLISDDIVAFKDVWWCRWFWCCLTILLMVVVDEFDVYAGFLWFWRFWWSWLLFMLMFEHCWLCRWSRMIWGWLFDEFGWCVLPLLCCCWLWIDVRLFLNVDYDAYELGDLWDFGDFEGCWVIVYVVVCFCVTLGNCGWFLMIWDYFDDLELSSKSFKSVNIISSIKTIKSST